jgi:hypothetical protein
VSAGCLLHPQYQDASGRASLKIKNINSNMDITSFYFGHCENYCCPEAAVYQSDSVMKKMEA